ncbi:MAG: response regulator [Elusimicrobiota bacterium]|nr:response regulator [Elusimicrobiota bacterium]
MDDEVLSTHKISGILNVDITSVQNWIKQKKLKAYKTPGGHRRVLRKDFDKFTEKYNIPVTQPGKINFLIVDDEDAVRITVRKIIKKKYPEGGIFEAKNGFAAGRTLAAENIGYLILDIRMPGMDGYEVMENIKNDSALGSPDIIVVTGYSEEGLEERVKKAGAKKLIIKPFDLKEFRDALDDITEKEK